MADHEQLSAYLDDELSAEERATVASALAADPELRAELESLRRARAFLLLHGKVNAPEGFTERTLGRLEQAPPRWSNLGRKLETALMLAALAAATLLVVLSGSGSGEQTRPGMIQVVAPPPAVQGAKTEEAVAPESSDPPVEDALTSPRRPVAPAPPPTAKTSPTASPLPGTAAPEDPGSSAKPLIPLAASAPFAAYGLETSDPETLLRLQRLVAHLGGELVTERGQPVSASGLDEGLSHLVIRVPSSALAELDRGLRSLGPVQKQVSKAEMFVSGEIEVPLTVKLSVGTDEE
ncbi:MAG: hypothetical protein JXX28_01595 [Deltaproteobacteria bacterium]|nr:hypothetical protein [Deltaproteobacteria bacterium]